MRQRAERFGGEEFASARGEGAVALGHRHGDESILARRLLGNRVDFLGAHPHRLFHQERITGVDQIVRDRRHLAVSPKCDDKIGTQRLEHGVVVGEDRRVADLGGALGDKA